MSPFGIKGFNKYLSFVSDVYLDEPNTFYILKDSQYLPVEIIFQIYKNKKILKVNNNSDRNQANLYTNYELYLDRSALRKPNADEYYHLDLIGLKVYDVNNNFIGVIDEITNNNNLDYLKIKHNDNFLIIPFTKKNVNKIELRKKKLFLYQKSYDF